MNHAILRVLHVLVATQDLEIEELDVKTTFVHGDLDEKYYMDHIEGYK